MTQLAALQDLQGDCDKEAIMPEDNVDAVRGQYVAGKSQGSKFFDVATDPCGDQNPFTEDDPRHGNWKRATRRAEEELSKLAELMPEAYPCRLENEWTRVMSEILRYGSPVSTISMSPLLIPFYRSTFDTWAWRNLAAIAGDEDLPIYDRWLINYAQSWLELIESRGDPEAIKRPLIGDLQTSLQAGIAHWKSEARKHLRLQEAQGRTPEIEVPAKGTEARLLIAGQDVTGLGAGPTLPTNLETKEQEPPVGHTTRTTGSSSEPIANTPNADMKWPARPGPIPIETLAEGAALPVVSVSLSQESRARRKPKPLPREEFIRLTAGRDTVTNPEAMHILGVSVRHLRRLVKGDQAAGLHPKLLTSGPRKKITVESIRVYLGYRP